MPEHIRQEPKVLVSTENLTEQEWLAYRRQGIGGSDVAAILGISPFRTARDLYDDKLNIASAVDDTGNWVALEMGHLLEPLVSASDSLPAILLSVLMCQIFWFAGIHGSLIVTGIMNPFWMANLSANQAALAAGTVLPHVYLQGFWDHYLLIGGVGSTLPLAFLLLRSRATHLRTIGKMGIVPSFFNINEPILFGAPIIMNPMMFIPFVCVPMVNAVLAYGATRLGWLSQVVSLTPWTTPAPIGASWAANWTLSPVVMCLICMVMSAVIYLPFLRAYERSLMKTEVEKAKNSVPVAETVS